MPAKPITDKQLIEGFRRRVWAVLRFRGIRVTHLEEMAPLGRGQLSHFLQARFEGTRTSLLFALRIADALQVDVGWLITGREPMKHRTYPQLKLEPVETDLPRGLAFPDYLDGWVGSGTSTYSPEAPAPTRKKRKKGKKKHR